MKTAVIFHRLGPYHFARLRAAGHVLPVAAIETSGADATYAWDKIAGAEGFERVTLFENADAQNQPAAEVAHRLAVALDKIRPQVVVVPGWADKAALGALHWCAINGIPAVIMSESTAWDEPRKPWKEFIKRQIVGLGSAALAGGTPHQDYLMQLGLPADRIFLGYDAVDNAYFAAEAAKVRGQSSVVNRQVSDIKSQGSVLLPPTSLARGGEATPLGRSQLSAFQDVSVSAFENTPFFLASARFIEKKNLPRLLEAYARYRQLATRSTLGTRHSALAGIPSSIFNSPSSDNCPPSSPWPLILLGDGPLRPDLCRLISDLSLQHSVLLPGFIQYPELPAYYARAGAFIHASTTEQWGLVVNEAMASGLPVLVSNRCGCAADLVQDGVNGFTFDPYNIEQLAQLMFKLSLAREGETTSPGSLSAFEVGRATPCAPPSLLPPGGDLSHLENGERSSAESRKPSGPSERERESQRQGEGASPSSILHPPSSTPAQMGAAMPFSSPLQSEIGNRKSEMPGEMSSPASGSSILHPPSATLAQMGAASQRLISAWGPDRFASGLKAAAECALKVGPVKPTLLQRLILKALLSR